MKKNNLLILSMLFLAASAPQKSPSTLLSLWEKKIAPATAVERSLASKPRGQCMKDTFNVATLKKEMEELEQKFKGSKNVSGKWKHLNLSKLPAPQANFLKTYGDDLGDLGNTNRFDYSACNDVPCIINKIYGKDNYIAGYVHYNWYLKFGNYLAVDNRIPHQLTLKPGFYNGKNIEFEKYLLSEIELYGFWRTSFMIKAPFSTLRYLKEIQVVPHGLKFDKSSSTACGLAYFEGHILLRGDCLQIYNKQGDSGEFYRYLIHEIAHQVDFEEGRKGSGFYRSHLKDYLNLSGFYKNEFVDKSGETQVLWEKKEGAKLVSTYAGLAPHENFAESLSHFRFDGDGAKKKMLSEHYVFVSHGYYHKKTHESEATLNNWLQENSETMHSEMKKAVQECHQRTSSPRSKYFKAKDFSQKLSVEVLNCIGGRAEEIDSGIIDKITMTDPDGCNLIGGMMSKHKWQIRVKDFLKNSLNKYLEEFGKNPESFQKLVAQQDKIRDKALAYETFINCYGEKKESDCFDSSMQSAATETAFAFDLGDELSQELATQYLSQHSYSAIGEEIKNSYKGIVLSHLDLIRNKTEILWQSCLSQNPNDDLPPVRGLLKIDDGYMISSLNNCLNSSLPGAVADIASEFSIDGIKLQNHKEEQILLDEIHPEVIKILNAHYLSEKQKESQVNCRKSFPLFHTPAELGNNACISL